MENKKRIRLKVASPCDANWDAMTGDEAIRFCGLCKKNVYQISNMTNEQVEELLAEAGEKKCGRFYQRKDGTLVTADCSVGLKRKRRKQAVIGLGAGVLSAIGVAVSSVGGAPPANNLPTQSTNVEPAQIEPEHIMMMGEVSAIPDQIEVVNEPVQPDEHQYEVKMGKVLYEEVPEDEIDELLKLESED